MGGLFGRIQMGGSIGALARTEEPPLQPPHQVRGRLSAASPRTGEAGNRWSLVSVLATHVNTP